MNLICRPLLQGIMAYWDEVPNTAVYTIKLFINEKMISRKINERTELYCSFNGLAPIDGTTYSVIPRDVPVSIGGYRGSSHSGLDYYVQVEAEDRNGKILEQSEKVKCSVKTL